MKSKILVTFMAAASLLVSGTFSPAPFLTKADAAFRLQEDIEKDGAYRYPVFDGERKINAFIKKKTGKAKRENQKLAGLVSGGMEASVERDDPEYICIALNSYNYCGGAHGMYYTEYLVFDRQSKKRLAYTDFVPEITAQELCRGVKSGLLKVTNRTGEYESTAPFLEERFARVSKNFCLNGDGSISLCYPVYELDCYAAGEMYIRLTEKIVNELKNIGKR